MNDKFHIKEIIYDGFATIKDRRRRMVLLVLYPTLLSSLIHFFLDAKITINYVDTIVGSLAIFTGFFFTLIVYVADKATNKKRELQESEEEEDQRFLKTYLTFTERLITQISYSIVQSVFIILIIIIGQYDLQHFGLRCDIEYIISAFMDILEMAIIFHFLIFLLLIVSNMYALFLEEIKQ